MNTEPAGRDDTIRASLHRIADAPPVSTRQFASAARAEAAQLRRKRVTVSLGGLSCIVAVIVAVVLTGPSADRPTGIPAVLPSNQPQCATTLPTRSATPVLAHSGPVPRLATVCAYGVGTHQLTTELGQIRPQDLSAFTAYIRSLSPANPACRHTAPISIIAAQMLFPDGKAGALVASTDSDCTSITDGHTQIAVSNHTLEGSAWGAILLPSSMAATLPSATATSPLPTGVTVVSTATGAPSPTTATPTSTERAQSSG